MASHSLASPASSSAVSLPVSTIYIKNLNTKINKQELRRSLYAFFSAYGQVIDIVALKTKALRGQAWIVYSDHLSAKAALRDAATKSLFGKPMVMEWAKTVSKAAKVVHGLHPDQATKAVDPDVSDGEQTAAHKRAFDEMNEGDEEDEGEDIDLDDGGDQRGQSALKRARRLS